MEPFIFTETGEKINPEYVALLRAMTVAEKFQKVSELNRAELANRAAQLHANYPDFTEAELDRGARYAMLLESFINEG